MPHAPEMPRSAPRRRRGGRGAAGAAALALLAAGCGDGTGRGDAADCDQPFRIGVMLGLTGVFAGVGDPQDKAVELFARRLRDDGGIDGHDVEFTTVDTTSEEGAAVNALRRLATDEQVIGIVGPSSSGEAIAVKAIAESLKVPTMAIAASGAILRPPTSYMFKEFPSSVDSLDAQLAHVEAQGLTKVAMVYADNGYGQEPAAAVRDLARARGLTVTGSESFAPTATDVAPQLRTLAAGDPDVLLVWAVNPANALVAKAARAVGLRAVVFQAPGAASSAYLDAAGPAAEGTLVQGSKIVVPDALSPADPQYEVVTEFSEAYEAEYGSPASQFGGGAYDAALLVATALDEGDVDPCAPLQQGRDALRDALETRIDDVPGNIAVYSFDEDQHGPTGIEGQAVLRVVDGAFELAGTG